MTYETLFPLIHQMELSSFLPLSDVRDLKQKQHYINLGYKSTYTVQQWKTMFPRINSQYIFFTNNEFSRIFYYDKEKYILIEIPFINTFPEFCDAEKLQNSVLRQVAQAQSLFAKRDWYNLLLMVKSALQLDLLKDLVLHEKPCGKIYKTFIRSYSSVEYGFSKIDSQLLKKILSGKTDTQKNATAAALADLPETVKIYRGETEKSRPYTEAFSWSLDEQVAFFFANRFPSSRPRIIQGRVKKSKILERIDRESEVLINSGDVTGIHEIALG